MKLQSLKLQNFRQFYGTQEIEFAEAGSARPVTVFHGFNGSGKTTLLNAFVWCLYGETTNDLESKQVANERAVEETQANEEGAVSLELRFEHRGRSYLATRSEIFSRDSAGEVTHRKSELVLGEIDASGQFNSLEAGSLRVKQILPPELSPFLFFNGERVERLARQDAYDQVESGIKTILGIEAVERGIDHLEKGPLKHLRKELSQNEGGELSDLDTQLAANEEKLADREKKRRDLEKSLAELDVEINLNSEEQSRIAKLTGLVEERREKEERLKEINSDLEREGVALGEEISKRGHLVFQGSAIAIAREKIEQAQTSGELPARLKPQFVDELIELGECICGRPIGAEDEEPHQHLVRWRQNTGLAAHEERISFMSGWLADFDSHTDDFLAMIDGHRAQQDRLLASQRTIKDQLGELEDQIGGRSADDDSRRLLEIRDNLTKEKLSSTLELHKLGEAISELEDLIGEQKKLLKKWEVTNQKSAKLQQQIVSVENVQSTLRKVLELRTEDARQSLTKRVGGIWDEAALKDYRASVSRDFRLTLEKSVGGRDQIVNDASTGEKQVLGLSFVSALVEKASKGSSKELGDEGVHYPLVMDSPYGSLEPHYQTQIAKWCCTLADQVVLFVSKSQWTSPVEQEYERFIGRQYILELQTGAAKSKMDIEIGGASHPYVVESLGADQTILRRIR